MTTDTDIIETESREIVVAQPIFGTSEPKEVLVRAKGIASELAATIRERRLTSDIQGKEYVRCEGWTTLGAMLGVFPVLAWTRPVERGWEARVEAKTLAGAIVGAAEAQCLRDEKSWSNREDFALRSMAQTRATAKALRMPLGFVMTLAGYEATPAEEMTFERETPKPEQADVRPPNCKQHGAMRFRKAGTSKAGKPYPSFWSCVERECNVSVNHADWLSQSKQMDAPREEPLELDKLPFED